jgi:hypothetical protein
MHGMGMSAGVPSQSREVVGERETEKGGREREGGQRSSCGNNMTVSLDQLNVLSLSLPSSGFVRQSIGSARRRISHN